MALIPIAIYLTILGRRWITPPPPPPEPRQYGFVPAGAPGPYGTVQARAEGRTSAGDRSTWPPRVVAAAAYLREAAGDPAGFEVVDWDGPVRNTSYDRFPGADETMVVTTRERDEQGGRASRITLVCFSKGEVIRAEVLGDSRSRAR